MEIDVGRGWSTARIKRPVPTETVQGFGARDLPYRSGRVRSWIKLKNPTRSP